MQPLIVRVDTPAARQIRFHCLAGDELAVRQGEMLVWLRPAGRIGQSGVRQRLAFAYRSDLDDCALSLEFGLFDPLTVEYVARASDRIAMAAMDRRWRPTIARLGRIPGEAARVATAEVRLEGPDIVAARRIVHPSYILDRLIARQRAIAVEEIEVMLYGRMTRNAVRLTA
ncbi:MAG: hypothetical protein WDM86_01485 [Rhizomicrobium sp.]